MLTRYIQAAMHEATYVLLENGTFYGEMPACKGVWSNANSLKDCREELQDSLRDGIILSLRLGHTVPLVNEL
jgi:predicted RNase H-like HicB family nuclease